MGLLNTSLWDSIQPGSTDTLADAGGIDANQIVDELLPSLHASSRSDLYPWTEAQLIQWIDEAVKRLATVACVFVGRDTSTLTVPSQATYPLPQQHVSTLHVSVGTTALRPASLAELEARDSGFSTATGTPDHWYEDTLGVGSIGLSPIPDAELSVAKIYNGWPTTVDKGQTMISAPGPLKAYLAMAVLAEAYGRESEMSMPDVAAHCYGRLDLYHTLFQHYYGRGI